MDGLQIILSFMRQWIERMKAVVNYLKESFLPDEESKEESDGLFPWF